MQYLKSTFPFLLMLAAVFSCDKEYTKPCESESNIKVNSAITKKAFIDPNSNAQHVFYYFDVKHSLENGSCKKASEPFFIHLTTHYSTAEDFSNPTEHHAASIAVPSLQANQVREIVSQVDFRETGYYRIQWEIDATHAIAETNEGDNTLVVEKFFVLVE